MSEPSHPPSDSASLKAELARRCRALADEYSRMRIALAALESRQGAITPAEPISGDRGYDWEEAYWELQAEYQSVLRDNGALLQEVQGRKRSQYGRRSERVLPEELLVAMRELKKMHPEQVPAGMLEELEKECSEREEKRQRRKKAREKKRLAAAQGAARQAVNLASERDDGDGGDDDGGGGGAKSSPRADKDAQSSAPVIPLRSVGNRNACLVGLTPHDEIISVPQSELACPACDRERALIGHQETHMLDIEMPVIKHLRLLQEKRACQRHPDAGVAVAAARDRPIAQGLPTAMLLAFLVVAKVQDHLPLERLSGMLQRWGAYVAPSTLGGWYQAAAEILAPLAEHLGKAVKQSSECMHTDATNVRVIDPIASGGSTRGSLWGYTVKEVGSYFAYTPDGSYEETRAVLSARAGPTMTDGHKAYVSQRLRGSKQATPVILGTHLNCFDHARRPVEEAFRLDHDLRASVILRHIQSLYRVEEEAKRHGLAPDQVKALREAKSRPLLDQLFADLASMQATVTPRSRLGRAIKTLLRRRAHLEAYLQNGSWPISNVLQETQFRSKALGQHNWLFIGSHHAAGNYAVLLTLVRSCMMLGIDPTAYLADVLVRVQRRGSSKALDDLLPAQWKKAHAFAVLKRGAAAA